MRKILRMISLILLLSPALHAQAVVGIWQATLPIENAPRVKLKITKGNDGLLQGAFDWLDYSAVIPLSTISFVAPDLNIVVAVREITYRAKLSPDGASLQGVWQEGKQSYPLTFALATPETLWKRDNATLTPMALSADPAFEVAVIKPSQPPSKTRTFALRTRHFNARNATVSDLVQFAYGVRTRQIESAPAWFDQPKFDIDAEPDAEGMPSVDQFRSMLRKLLADRFQLKIQTVQRIVPVYALTIDKDHHALTPSDTAVNQGAQIYARAGEDGQMLVQFIDHTMPDFANLAMNFIPDRQIVDETSLAGHFDFRFTASTSALQGSDGNEKSTEFLRAMESIGFRLTPKRGPIEVLVIEHLEKPSAN